MTKFFAFSSLTELSPSNPSRDADGPLEERPVGEDAVLHVELELELAVLHPQEEAGAAADVQVGATLKHETSTILVVFTVTYMRGVPIAHRFGLGCLRAVPQAKNQRT